MRIRAINNYLVINYVSPVLEINVIFFSSAYMGPSTYTRRSFIAGFGKAKGREPAIIA